MAIIKGITTLYNLNNIQLFTFCLLIFILGLVIDEGSTYLALKNFELGSDLEESNPVTRQIIIDYGAKGIINPFIFFAHQYKNYLKVILWLSSVFSLLLLLFVKLSLKRKLIIAISSSFLIMGIVKIYAGIHNFYVLFKFFELLKI